MFSYKFCSSGHGNGIHCDYLTNFFQFSLTNPQISHGTLLKLNVDSKDLWNLEKLLKKDVIFGIYSSNFRVCFPLNQNALLAPRKPFTTMENPTIWRYWRCISYETWWIFSSDLCLLFREVCVSLRKKRCHHPKGKNAYDSTDPEPVSPPKGDLRSSAATESTGSGGTCRPLGVEGWWDGGMVFVAAVMVGVGVMKHEIGTQFGVGSNNASYGNFEGFPL